ncbi:hypothetical protein J6590_067364 [Homalodisca vitripennis]|nr:hypothetical protein J6590_067364 [Homalodisca vitripennis]
MTGGRTTCQTRLVPELEPPVGSASRRGSEAALPRATLEKKCSTKLWFRAASLVASGRHRARVYSHYFLDLRSSHPIIFVISYSVLEARTKVSEQELERESEPASPRGEL